MTSAFEEAVQAHLEKRPYDSVENFRAGWNAALAAAKEKMPELERRACPWNDGIETWALRIDALKEPA
jgi:hypothetical protein